MKKELGFRAFTRNPSFFALQQEKSCFMDTAYGMIG